MDANVSMTSKLRALHKQLGIPSSYFSKRVLSLITEAASQELRVIASAPREIKLIVPAASAWESLRAAAEGENVTLLPISGFRSVDYQAELFRRKLAAGKSIEEILAVNAPPGFSEHHSGRALDIATTGSPPLEETFAEIGAFDWLVQNGGKFGFRLSYPRGNPAGFVFEPWHWSWSPNV